MRFKCIPVMRQAYEQIAMNGHWRQLDFQRNDGGYHADEEGLCLVYLCYDIEQLPFRPPHFEYGGEFVLRKAYNICQGFVALKKGWVALLLQEFDEATLTPEQKELIKQLSMKCIDDCRYGRKIPTFF